MSLPLYAEHPQHLAALRAAALRAVDPAAAVQRSLTSQDLDSARRVFLVGAGKAGVAMARAAAAQAGERLVAGVVAVPQLPEFEVPRVTFIQGGHPTPSDGSLAAGRALAQLLAQAGPGDLVVAVISGGGSALLELLRPGISLPDLQTVNDQLLMSGAAIHEINAVRIRLSQIKGGGLARLARPARVLGLILSDVVGSPLASIASGPTVPQPADPGRALAVVDNYQLRESLPPSVAAVLNLPPFEAPAGPNDSPAVENRLIGSNRVAGEAAAQAARGLGFEAQFVADDWHGEAREMGRRFAELMGRSGGGAHCRIAGGESTVTVRGAGRGGRNQEAALAAALALDGQPEVVIGTFATDGVDGPTDAAGAVVTGDTITRARALGLDPRAHLDDNDAYSFFLALGDLVVTGPTGTNVNDLLFGLRYTR